MPVYPKKVEEIKKLFESLEHQNYWDWERGSSSSINRGVGRILSFDSENKTTENFSKANQEFFTVFSFSRSNHQLNEAINKFWGSLEILNASCSRDRIGKKFLLNYAIGTSGPTLYYAAITSLISMFSLFGCISLRGDTENEDYFLVRQKEDWELKKKKSFINDDLKVGKTGRWHQNLFFTFEGLTKNGVELPSVDLTQLNELRRIREKCHYRFLNDCAMVGDYREILPQIVNKIPFVEDILQKNMVLLKSVRYISKKGLEDRFKRLSNNTYSLYRRINCFPKSIINSEKQTVLGVY